MNNKTLLMRIESFRTEMILLTKTYPLDDKRVIQASHKLDALINEYIQTKNSA